MKNATFEDSQPSELEPQERVVLTARSVYSDRLAIVKEVIRAYNQVAFLPELVAINIDPQPETRSLRKSEMSIDYSADVESALRRYLVQRNDRIQLREAWNNLLMEDDKLIKERERRLVLSLAPIFVRHGLEPVRYFAPKVRRKSQWA